MTETSVEIKGVNMGDIEKQSVETKQDTDLVNILRYARNHGFVTGPIRQVGYAGDTGAIFLYKGAGIKPDWDAVILSKMDGDFRAFYRLFERQSGPR